jgi:hypothetical protein
VRGAYAVTCKKAQAGARSRASQKIGPADRAFLDGPRATPGQKGARESATKIDVKTESPADGLSKLRRAVAFSGRSARSAEEVLREVRAGGEGCGVGSSVARR